MIRKRFVVPALIALSCTGVSLAGAAPRANVHLASLSGTLPEPGVVWISDRSRHASTPGAVITQRGKSFIPELTVVVAGSEVRFRNDDTVDHSVYSVSPADPFDLGIYEPGPGKDVAFARPGVVEIHCHIHRHMRATLVVVDGPAARVETAGAAWKLAGVRAGRHTLHVWTAEHGESERSVDVR